MRRKIELYINGNRADLDGDGLVLMNYAFTDLEKPTAVKNSYSKQITLPGTPTNAGIFGHIGRADRKTGVGFNPGKKTAFDVFNAQGERMLTGYLRLDSVIRSGDLVKGYKVTLFGGLGEFFYALSYDENGDKKTLASLDYLAGGPDELNFKITKDNVLAAWDRLGSWGDDEDPASVWDIINFAPAYNGIPEGNFSADKAVVKATNVGLSASVVDDGVTYSAQSDGSVLVNLAKAHTEWEVKDLRSYLQRPVLSMRAFLEAICKPENNGGYEVVLDEWITNEARSLYKTLPMLPSISSVREEEGEYTLNSLPTSVSVGDSWIAGPSIVEEVSSSTTIKATMSVGIRLRFSSVSAGTMLYPRAFYMSGSSSASRTNYYRQMVVFSQMLALANGVVVGGSTIHCAVPEANVMTKSTPEDIAEICGFTPAFQAEYNASCQVLGNDGRSVVTGITPSGNFLGLDTDTYQVEAPGVTSYRLAVSCYVVEWSRSYTWSGSTGRGQWRNPELRSVTAYGMKGAMMNQSTLSDSTANIQADGGLLIAGSRSWYTLAYKTASEVRSGALIDKASLLSSKHTPAEYLISLVKILGGVFRYERAEKKIYITSRNGFYNTGLAPIDLTKRVDRGKDITITPLVAKSKWYDFVLEQVESSFAVEYKAIYGFEAGIQRVNTGYEFDADVENMMDGNVYRQAITCLEHGPYYCALLVSSAYRPPVFIDKGNTYTLWSSDGKNLQVDIQRPPSSAYIEYLNEYGHEGYDSEYAWKLQLHDKENKPLDGDDILVYYSGKDTYAYFKVSDDSAIMSTINEGQMCWDLNPGDANGIRIADFHRYDTDTEWGVLAALDFGIPREVDIPAVNFDEDCSRYVRGWRAYMRDRLSQDTKVMKCRVDMSGLQVGPELLRRFFYYEGCLWVLNKISNYSITTWDPVECEFVQVQDIENYINGQILE